MLLLPILYQDPDLIVVDKPAGIPTHAADPRDPYPGDALRIVQGQTGLAYLGMHQRLDAETSGVLLFSARPEANRALAAAFEGGAVRKAYLALVWGAPPRAEGLIDAPIARDQDGRYRVTSAGDPRGQSARTRYRVVQRGGWKLEVGGWKLEVGGRRVDSEVTLLEITPETGRTHQIRVHLAHIGCPVVGDPLYPPLGRDGPAYPPYPRLCLHAWQLALPHPATGRPVTFIAPLPVWVQGAGDWIRGFSRSDVQGEKPAKASSPAPQAAVSRAGFARETGAGSLLQLAVARRAPLAADPDTSIYRLVNAAADGLPGLTVDRYGDALVASAYDQDLSGLGDLAALAQLAGARAVYARYRPRQASRLTEAELAALAPAAPVAGPDLGPAWVAHEDGLAYLIRPGEGLSVGLFPDMREGRGRVRAWAAGRTVLNTFAYTCGFGVAALAGGATRVLNLDLSKAALAWGQENYRANGFEPDPYDFVFGDVFDWLARLARRGEHFELVILDPPGFARARGRAFSAARDYGELAGLAAQVTAAGGVLLACCNVAELPWRAFRERVLAGLAAAGRQAEIIGIHHEPALDFPAPPGQEPYLKMVWLQV